jgi:hypothetical protein
VTALPRVNGRCGGSLRGVLSPADRSRHGSRERKNAGHSRTGHTVLRQPKPRLCRT